MPIKCRYQDHGTISSKTLLCNNCKNVDLMCLMQIVDKTFINFSFLLGYVGI